MATKCQTGFDQLLLSAMYVDRKLGGNQAVQTLSRLNRTTPSTGKNITYGEEFVNEPTDIRADFWEYHTTDQRADVSDPNLVLALRNKLNALAYYAQHDAERVGRAVSKPKVSRPI